jgi:hypothetical protein
MIEPDALTRDSFFEELRERVDALRIAGVAVPMRLELDLAAVFTGCTDNPFEEPVFRMAVAHLLNGLDPEIADETGGPELLEERLHALSANLGVSLKVAAERHGQPV